MANNDIKQRIVLEGEKQYSQSLKEAQRNLKTLRSELKAETAELGKNATAQEKNEAKVKSLQKQIKEQEKIVKTYRDALAEVKEKYGDNEDAIAKWEQKLNEARTSLANMKNELGSVGEGFKNVKSGAEMATVAAKSVADSLGNIAKVGDTISSAIEGVFTGMMNTVRGMVAEIWQLIAETAAKADQWGDLAGFYGSSAEQVQEWDRAISGAGADFQQFIAFMNQLEFRGKDDKLINWLGISDENYENRFEFALLAMNRLAEMRKELGAGKFNEQLGDVFGGKSQGIVTLIGEWDRVLEKRQQYKENGFLLDQGELDMMGEVDNELHDIEEKWDMLKAKFATGFGNVTLDIMTEVQGSLDALAKYFNAETQEEREAALEELHSSILGTFEAIAQAIRDGIKILDGVAEELKESDDPLVQELGNALDAIVEALKWFTDDNANNFKHALEIIAGVWVGGKVAGMLGAITSLAGNLAVLKLSGGLGGLFGRLFGKGGGGGTGTGGSPTTGVGGSPVAPAVGGGLMTSILNKAKGGALKLSSAASTSGLTNLSMLWDWATHATPFRSLNPEYGGGLSWDNVKKAVNEIAQETAANVEKNRSTFKQDWEENKLYQFASKIVGLNKLGEEWAQGDISAEDAMKIVSGEKLDDVVEAIHDSDEYTEEEIAALVNLTEVLSGKKQTNGRSPVNYAQSEAEQFIQQAKEALANDDFGLIESLLFGTGNRSDLQKMQLYNMLNGEQTSMGNNTWLELQRLWGGEGMDMGRLVSILQSVVTKYEQMENSGMNAGWWTSQGGNTGDQITSGDLKNFNSVPGLIAKAVQSGVSAIKVQMDGRTVGMLVAPYVSQQIASEMVG